MIHMISLCRGFRSSSCSTLVGNTTEDALQLLAPRTPEIRYYMASQPVTKLCKGGRKLFQFQIISSYVDQEKCRYQLDGRDNIWREKHCMLHVHVLLLELKTDS